MKNKLFTALTFVLFFPACFLLNAQDSFGAQDPDEEQNKVFTLGEIPLETKKTLILWDCASFGEEGLIYYSPTWNACGNPPFKSFKDIPGKIIKIISIINEKGDVKYLILLK